MFEIFQTKSAEGFVSLLRGETGARCAIAKIARAPGNSGGCSQAASRAVHLTRVLQSFFARKIIVRYILYPE